MGLRRGCFFRTSRDEFIRSSACAPERERHLRPTASALTRSHLSHRRSSRRDEDERKCGRKETWTNGDGDAFPLSLTPSDWLTAPPSANGGDQHLTGAGPSKTLTESFNQAADDALVSVETGGSVFHLHHQQLMIVALFS